MRSTTTRSQNDVHRECKIIIYPLPWSCVSSPPYFSLILRNIPVLAFYLLRPLMIKLSVESSSMSATTSHMHFSSIVERFFINFFVITILIISTYRDHFIQQYLILMKFLGFLSPLSSTVSLLCFPLNYKVRSMFVKLIDYRI